MVGPTVITEEAQAEGQNLAAALGGIQVATLVRTRKSISYSVRGRVPVVDQNTSHPPGYTLISRFLV